MLLYSLSSRDNINPSNPVTTMRTHQATKIFAINFSWFIFSSSQSFYIFQQQPIDRGVAFV